MPPMMRKRGRLKGTNDTVIGVPAKKRATKSISKPKLITFEVPCITEGER